MLFALVLIGCTSPFSVVLCLALLRCYFATATFCPFLSVDSFYLIKLAFCFSPDFASCPLFNCVWVHLLYPDFSPLTQPDRMTGPEKNPAVNGLEIIR